jgi:ElaB/YqjD/DUF883 family membrane-anchored ribosome-binding protein
MAELEAEMRDKMKVFLESEEKLQRFRRGEPEPPPKSEASEKHNILDGFDLTQVQEDLRSLTEDVKKKLSETGTENDILLAAFKDLQKQIRELNKILKSEQDENNKIRERERQTLDAIDAYLNTPP